MTWGVFLLVLLGATLWTVAAFVAWSLVRMSALCDVDNDGVRRG